MESVGHIVSSLTPYGKNAETAFPVPFVWSNARNAVSAIFRCGNIQSSCHNSIFLFFLAVMTLFLATGTMDLAVCRLFPAIIVAVLLLNFHKKADTKRLFGKICVSLQLLLKKNDK